MIRNRAKVDGSILGSLLQYAQSETGASAASLERRISVVVPVLLDAAYDYLLPPGMVAEPGSFVSVPFGAQRRIGVVWDRPDADGREVDADKLKAVYDVYDVPPLPEISLRFCEWIARYTLAPRGMVLRLMMSASDVFEPVKPRFGVRLGGPEPARLTEGRERVLYLARDGLVRSKSDLALQAGVGNGVIDGLVKAGTLVVVELPPDPLRQPDPDHAKPEFQDEQQIAVASLRAAVDAGRFSTTLLDGVTGSGKTEVYFEAAAAAMAQGRQVLIMLPEIALTGQFISRFERRFGCKPLEWHSAVGPAERARIWKAVASGEARAIVGARSALFLPYRELGLIVVDEEHDAGFKQEDRVHYQARDMAVVRGSLGDAAAVLASATPSIESHVNAMTKRYGHVRLTERYSDAALPIVKAIDLRTSAPERGRWLSPQLVEAVVETTAAGQQSLLYLNRRGYAPLTLCRSCGHRVECPQCTAWLVEHRFSARLHCHHCGFQLPLPKHCPKCGDFDGLVACGPGVERVAEEVAETFPDARVAILSSDLVPGIKQMRAILERVTAGDVDIIIGTQIVAKGHHFPALQTVGVVDGDLGLANTGDPRAGERTFQLLHQVTGRAGREGRAGRGFVQTHMPEHPVMAAIVSGDREAFLDYEIAARQRALMPPFGRLAALIVTGRNKRDAEAHAQAIVRRAPPAKNISVLGPAEAPIAVIRGRHRYRILVRAPREIDVQIYLRQWLDQLPKAPSDLRLSVDVDPYSFL